MVFLTSLDILDTGFLTQTTRTNQLAAGDRVNSGVALRLKGVNLDLSGGANLDKTVTPGSTGAMQVPWISNEPTIVTIELVLNRKYTDTSNEWGVDDMSYLTDITQLCSTKGLKALYYPVKNGVFDYNRKRDNQMLYILGSPDTVEDQGDISISLWDGTAEEAANDLTTVNYIAVRFDTFKIEQLPKNKMVVTLTGVITT